MTDGASGQNDTPSRQRKGDRKRFVSFAFAASELLIEVEVAPPHFVAFASGATRELLGRSEKSIEQISVLDLIVPEDRDYFSATMARLKAQGRLAPVGVQLISGDDKTSNAMMGGFHMPGDGTMFLSLTRSERLWGEEIEASARDGDTGILDRDAFVKRARVRGLAAAGLTGAEQELVLLVLEDIDALRAKHGEETVKTFLRKLGAYLRALSKGGDSAGRLDKEHFGAFAEKEGDYDRKAPNAEELIQRAAVETGIGGVGVKAFRIDLDITGLSEADAAKALVHSLNKFSQTGFNEKFEISNMTAAAHTYLEETVDRMAFLRRSLKSENVTMAFQPIIDLKNRQAWRYEALVRLEGFKSPLEMILFAEEVGLADEFDLMVINQVLDILKAKKQIGWRPKVSINLSVQSMSSPMFLASLRRIVKNAGPDFAQQVSFELTETAGIADLDRLDSAIQSLREDGHEVCLDDVGSGKTSFEALKYLKCDYAKIDGMYVEHFQSDPQHRSLLENIVRTCHGLKMPIVAERVTDEDQARTLAQMGVQYGQGYLFGKPSTGGDALSYTPPDNGRRRGVQVGWG